MIITFPQGEGVPDVVARLKGLCLGLTGSYGYVELMLSDVVDDEAVGTTWNEDASEWNGPKVTASLQITTEVAYL